MAAAAQVVKSLLVLPPCHEPAIVGVGQVPGKGDVFERAG
jgi:hypothetical protein